MKNAKKKSHLEDENQVWEPGYRGKRSIRTLSAKESAEIDRKAGLEMISLRLPAETIETFKRLANKEGIKYQPFMRRVLMKYSESQKLPDDQIGTVIELLRKIDSKIS